MLWLWAEQQMLHVRKRSIHKEEVIHTVCTRRELESSEFSSDTWAVDSVHAVSGDSAAASHH